MGQFGNQPDFATNDIQVVTPNNTISSATNLDSSIIYIGDNTTTGDVMIVIPAGTVGPSVISDFLHLVMQAQEALVIRRLAM